MNHCIRLRRGALLIAAAAVLLIFPVQAPASALHAGAFGVALVGSVVLVAAIARRLLQDIPEWLPMAAAYAIGIPACFWTIQRVVGFWSSAT